MQTEILVVLVIVELTFKVIFTTESHEFIVVKVADRVPGPLKVIPFQTYGI